MTDKYDEAYEAGREFGVAAGSWVIDGNTDEDSGRRILQGIEDGDSVVLDMQPAPLSGEWAGESIPELSDRFGIDLEDGDIADAFEAGFADGYWAEVERAARYLTDDEESKGVT